MFKILSFTFLSVIILSESFIITPPNVEKPLELEAKGVEQWIPHIKDFFDLIDIEKIMIVAVNYLDDPEVINFAMFLMSTKSKELVYEFESMDEFKEAFAFLASKGYDVEFIIELVNSLLNLPPFEKPAILRKGKGMTGLIEDLIAALPKEDMKELFESKLESSPEVAKLFEIINSKEFVDILKRMSQNPKFKEMKMILEGYGFDFGHLCVLAKEVFGDYYQGIFCE